MGQRFYMTPRFEVNGVNETHCGPRGTPVGSRTKLGWTITCPLPSYIRSSEGVFLAYVRSPDEELHNQVKSWWRSEEFGCKYHVETQRRTVAEHRFTLFERCLQRDSNLTEAYKETTVRLTILVL